MGRVGCNQCTQRNSNATNQVCGFSRDGHRFRRCAFYGGRSTNGSGVSTFPSPAYSTGLGCRDRTAKGHLLRRGSTGRAVAPISSAGAMVFCVFSVIEGIEDQRAEAARRFDLTPFLNSHANCRSRNCAVAKPALFLAVTAIPTNTVLARFVVIDPSCTHWFVASAR